MGRNDVDGDHLRNISRNDTGSDTGSTGFCQRSGIAVYYHAGDSIVLDGTDAGGKCIGTDRADDQRNPPSASVVISEKIIRRWSRLLSTVLRTYWGLAGQQLRRA